MKTGLHHPPRLLALCAGLGVGACGPTEEEKRAAEGEAYARSARLTSSDPAGAKAACLEIESVALRDECLMFLTRARVKIDRSAADTCDELTDRYHKDACWLEVSDALELGGAAGEALCAKAGSLKERCLVHAFHRESMTYAHRYGPGREAAFYSWVESRATELGVHGSHRQFAVKQTALLIARRRLPHPYRPFSVRECGSANSEVCVQAYRIANMQRRSSPVTSEMCDEGVTVEEATSNGFVPWEPEANELVAVAWDQLCQDPSMRQAAPPG